MKNLKTPLNVLVREDTFKALINYKKQVDKQLSKEAKKPVKLSFLVEDAIIYFLNDNGISVKSGKEGGS